MEFTPLQNALKAYHVTQAAAVSGIGLAQKLSSLRGKGGSSAAAASNNDSSALEPFKVGLRNRFIQLGTAEGAKGAKRQGGAATVVRGQGGDKTDMENKGVKTSVIGQFPM